ncbi:hypothetical protein PAMC26577_35975 [Caballeronia sordidicola]|uniref:Uncharacterized protein n=1 Tax=Caballeronia sordidicola TaxID=196367 RepID=A0A242M9W7_CABSO|nr:hypothetical protein PAMC26577_35975 [Caballeronia sordidicola]
MDKSHTNPAKARQRIETLLTTMSSGGFYGADDIPWFNGGLFAVVGPCPNSTLLIVRI